MIYVDTSAIVKLYIKESDSLSVSEWIKKNNQSIPLTSLIELEFITALKLKQFRHEIQSHDFDKTLIMLREHENKGVYYRPVMDWLHIFTQALSLSNNHTSNIGSRSLDILHISSAIFLEMEGILTFDERQAQLSTIAGLKIIDTTAI